MSTYVPIDVALVTCRLQGKQPPPNIRLAQMFPCKQCGAPAGMACTEKDDLCWRARLLSDSDWRTLAEARKKGKGAPGGWLDEIWTGMHRLGMNITNPAATTLRWMKAEDQALVKAVLAVLDQQI